ncbi:GATA zinc finger [Microdochium nivale]|nr:GATA zinc finger [Microdochium nivale]
MSLSSPSPGQSPGLLGDIQEGETWTAEDCEPRGADTCDLSEPLITTAQQAGHCDQMLICGQEALETACFQTSPLPLPRLGLSHSEFARALAMAQWTFRQAELGFEPPAAFIAVDLNQDDLPVVFVSNEFAAMTGYDHYEILGRNCRFLQYPPTSTTQEFGSESYCPKGHSQDSHRRAATPGYNAIPRDDIDTEHSTVSQHIVPSFRKNGDMFTNSVTMVSTPDTAAGARLMFGFSQDTTTSITQRDVAMGDAPSFSLLARPGDTKAPPAICTPPETLCSSLANVSPYSPTPPRLPREPAADSPIRWPSPPSTAGIRTPAPPCHDAWQMPEPLHEALLDQLDGLVFVVSVKGLIRYASPSCSRLVNSTAGLADTNLLELCHDADRRLLLRGLSAMSRDDDGDGDDLLFRLAMGDARYAWLGGTGRPWCPGGTARERLVLLSCYPREMPRLSRQLVASRGGRFGDRDLWLRISPSGLILAVLSAVVPAVLGLSPEWLSNLRGGGGGGNGNGGDCHVGVAASFQDMLKDADVERFQEALADLGANDFVTTTCRLSTTDKYDLCATVNLYPERSARGSCAARSAILQCKVTWALLRKENTTSTTPISTKRRHVAEKKARVRDKSDNRPNNSKWDDDADGDDDEDDDEEDDDDDIMADLSAEQCGNSPLEAHRLKAQNAGLQAEVERLEAAAKQRRRMKKTTTLAIMTANATATSATTTTATNDNIEGGGSHSGGALYRQLLRKGCANCHTKASPEWRKGPSGMRDLCNRCGLRWAKTNRDEQQQAVRKRRTGPKPVP